MASIIALIRDERGIQHAEEALLLALIAVALTGVVITLKTSMSNVFSTAGTKMTITP